MAPECSTGVYYGVLRGRSGGIALGVLRGPSLEYPLGHRLIALNRTRNWPQVLVVDRILNYSYCYEKVLLFTR